MAQWDMQVRTGVMAAGIIQFTGLQMRPTSVVDFCRKVTGGAEGHLREANRVNETGFDKGDGTVEVRSSSGTETSTIQLIVYNLRQSFDDL